jgi:hypothetical protein
MRYKFITRKNDVVVEILDHGQLVQDRSLSISEAADLYRWLYKQYGRDAVQWFN